MFNITGKHDHNAHIEFHPTSSTFLIHEYARYIGNLIFVHIGNFNKRQNRRLEKITTLGAFVAVVATVATAAMVIVMRVLALNFLYQKATDLSSFTKLQIWIW